MKKAFFILAAMTMMFASCSKEDNPTSKPLSEQIIGKWIFADRNGELTPTNKKRVFNFVSDTKAYVSASHSMGTPDDTEWFDHTEANVAINGNTVTLTMHLGKHTTMVDEFNVTAINDTEFTARLKVTLTVDGIVERSSESTIHLTKVTKDYKKDVIGTWEGRVSSEEGSEYDDGELHRWEYKDDGTYVYYRQDDNGDWVDDVNQMSEYLCDGTLLCTRWKNVGEDQEENREWWEILSIENGVMKWHALRQREDGSTYTTSFYMTKVEE